jgi:hypothetical protein
MDYDDINFEKKLVVNGVIYQDSLVKINVSRNKSILEAVSILPFIENALAKLFENGTFIETLIYDSMGYYHSNLITKAKTSYKVEVEVAEYDKAIAYFKFEEIKNYSVNVIKTQIFDSTYHVFLPFETDTNVTSVNVELDLSFTDNSNQNNFYDWKAETDNPFYIYEECVDNDCITRLLAISESDDSRHIYLAFSNQSDYYKYNSNSYHCYDGFYCNGQLSDDLFNGDNITLSFNTNYMTNDLNPISLFLYSYPEGYINYWETLMLYQDARNNPFSQPVNIYSNVENGIGFVCGITCCKVEINLN